LGGQRAVKVINNCNNIVLKRSAHTKPPLLLAELPIRILSVFWLACQIPFPKKLIRFGEIHTEKLDSSPLLAPCPLV
ncbi:MAG: hypothetical protein WBC22_16405, partial [Sedimentisphaerales bacterium]